MSDMMRDKSLADELFDLWFESQIEAEMDRQQGWES